MEKIPPILRHVPEELIGERVLVRPWREGDAPAIWEAIEESREQIRQWLPWVDGTKRVEDCIQTGRRSMAKWITREDLMLTIWDRSSGRYLGGSGLHRIDWDIPAFEIGYWLRTSAQGQGYMSEAVALIRRMAFEDLGANRVTIHCSSGNERSAAVARRLGFAHEGTLRNDARETDGELRDTLIFAMTPDDYACCSTPGTA